MIPATLSDVRAVVTGGGDSTGLAVAAQLLSRGARVHIADVRPEAVDHALAAHRTLTGTVADVGHSDDVRRIFKDARRELGSVNTLVSVVGIPGPQSSVEGITDEEWTRTFDVNVNGVFYAVRESVPEMKRNGGGTIVTFSSGSTRTNMPNRLAYVASKWAVEGITRALARELGPHNIRVNAILPGLIDNARMQAIIDKKARDEGCTPQELKERYLRYISMRASIEPEELGATVAFLCSADARHISGQLLGVDGNIEWEP
ncbi:MAG TPA: SDR family oxidoreductase [Steroidobacteraceae bacterium]|nr:SDR family oxidoreductase [Steroidobacteraceae bacterium]